MLETSGRGKIWSLAAAGAVVIGVSGCVGGGAGLGGLGGGMGGGSPQPRTLNVTLAASGNVNPGPDGRAAPLPVQLYVLRSTGTFQSLDYFGLRAGSGLSGDQVDSRSVSLRPGETKQLVVNTGTDGAYIGVAAGYRNIDSANWRAVTPIGTSDSYSVSAGRSSVSISAR